MGQIDDGLFLRRHTTYTAVVIRKAPGRMKEAKAVKE